MGCGYSRVTSKNLVKSLKEQSYVPGPVRRVWIPKPNTKIKLNLAELSLHAYPGINPCLGVNTGVGIVP
jgi:hypothetical protein